jgi:hypothetical protein
MRLAIALWDQRRPAFFSEIAGEGPMRVAERTVIPWPIFFG